MLDNMVECKFCKGLSDNDDFCSCCGKSLIEEEACELVSNNGWEEEIVILRCVSKKSKLRDEDVLRLPGIKGPTIINREEEKVLLTVDESYIELSKLMYSRELSFEGILKISKSILNIFKTLEENRYTLDEISLDDFEINKRDISDVVYKQSRRISRDFIYEDNYMSKNSFVVPEKNSLKGLNKSSNVYLFGKIFTSLLFNGKYLSGLDEERYSLYNISLFREDVPYEYHEFLNKITSFYIEERYPSIVDVMKVLENISDRNDRVLYQLDLACKITGCTNVGCGKLAKSKKNSEDNDEEKYNEDILFFDYFENKKIMAVGDGVSTAKYGSGKEASNILKEKIIEVWDRRKRVMESKSDFEFFVRELCSLACEDIISSVKDDIVIHEGTKSVGGIMATTLVIAVIIDNKMYYCSIGDSFIYLYNSSIGLNVLTNEENILNKRLKNGASWNQANSSDDKDYILNYIGKSEIINCDLKPTEPEYKIEETYVEVGDIVMLCTDGLTDYVSSQEGLKNVWSKDKNIKEILSAKDISLEAKCEKLIEVSNNNGGGDNITVILGEII